VRRHRGPPRHNHSHGEGLPFTLERRDVFEELKIAIWHC